MLMSSEHVRISGWDGCTVIHLRGRDEGAANFLERDRVAECRSMRAYKICVCVHTCVRTSLPHLM